MHIGSNDLKLSPAFCLLSPVSSFPILPPAPSQGGQKRKASIFSGYRPPRFRAGMTIPSQTGRSKKHFNEKREAHPYCPPLAGVACFSRPGVDVLHIGSNGLKLSPVFCLLYPRFPSSLSPPPKGVKKGRLPYFLDTGPRRYDDTVPHWQE